MVKYTISTTSKNWTIAEAKARLSEVLRRADETPQYIGTKNAYVLVPAEKWQSVNQPEKPLGQWLVDNLAGLENIELPDRVDPERDIPFQ